MSEVSTVWNKFNWRLPLFISAAALIILVPITIYDDNAQFLFVVLATPVIAVVLLVTAIVAAIRGKWLRSFSVLSAIVGYCAISWFLLRNSAEVRAEGRWLLWSEKYKAEMSGQHPPTNGELKHIEWDGFGWAGTDTVVYLVFDPSDSLAHAAKSGSLGKFEGIPCEIPLVYRLEEKWYSVRFYTNSGWEACA